MKFKGSQVIVGKVTFLILPLQKLQYIFTESEGYVDLSLKIAVLSYKPLSEVGTYSEWYEVSDTIKHQWKLVREIQLAEILSMKPSKKRNKLKTIVTVSPNGPFTPLLHLVHY